MSESVRLRITSDGTTAGTKVFVGDEQLASVQSVSYHFAVGDSKPTVVIAVRHTVDLDVPEGIVITDEIVEES